MYICRLNVFIDVLTLIIKYMIRKIFAGLLMVVSSLYVFAQEPTSMWPYIYSDFQQGTVYFNDTKTLSAPINIHLLKSKLHYIEKDHIKEAISDDILLALIGNDKYYVRNGQLMRVVTGDSTGFIAELAVADFDAIMDSGGAYGSSSNVQATRKLSSLEIGGVHITNHMELKSKKDAGSLLPLSKKYFIVTVDAIYPANRKAFENMLPAARRAELKPFLKKNKINWRQPDSLALLLNFLKD